MSESSSTPELTIAPDTVFGLIEILHELGGQDQGLEREDGDDGDDASAESLEADPDDARWREVATLIHDLNADEQLDLVALVLVGRDDFGIDEWKDARTEAQDRIDDEGARFVYNLIAGDEASAEFLESGLDAFGHSFSDWDSETVTARPDATAGDEEPGDAADDAQRQTPGQAATVRRNS